MRTRSFVLAAAMSLLATVTLLGCGSSNNPPDAFMQPRPAPPAPRKTPTTVEEKIAAIQSAPIPDKDKEAAIARVKSGQL